jgi:hypothetical protein
MVEVQEIEKEQERKTSIAFYHKQVCLSRIQAYVSLVYFFFLLGSRNEAMASHTKR